MSSAVSWDVQEKIVATWTLQSLPLSGPSLGLSVSVYDPYLFQPREPQLSQNPAPGCRQVGSWPALPAACWGCGRRRDTFPELTPWVAGPGVAGKLPPRPWSPNASGRERENEWSWPQGGGRLHWAVHSQFGRGPSPLKPFVAAGCSFLVLSFSPFTLSPDRKPPAAPTSRLPRQVWETEEFFMGCSGGSSRGTGCFGASESQPARKLDFHHSLIFVTLAKRLCSLSLGVLICTMGLGGLVLTL